MRLVALVGGNRNNAAICGRAVNVNNPASNVNANIAAAVSYILHNALQIPTPQAVETRQQGKIDPQRRGIVSAKPKPRKEIRKN